MGGHRHTGEGDHYLYPREFRKENIILTHYTLSEGWLHLLDGLRVIDKVHTCQEAATPQQREEWTHQPCGAVVTDTEESISENEDRLPEASHHIRFLICCPPCL